MPRNVASKQSTAKQKGFTLVELMVVISIIALLSAIGLTIFSQAQIAARDGKRLSDMQEVQKALEQYYATNQKYPPEVSSDINLVSELNTYFQNTAPPSDPNKSFVGDTEYRYYACATSASYNICSKMESCNGKCNMAAAPDGCAQVGAPGSVITVGAFYCLKSLSN